MFVYIALIACRTLHQQQFIRILQQLTSSNRRLTCLSITTHRSNITLTQLLDVCPELTHLTVITLNFVKDFYDVHELEPLNTMITTNSNVVYLHIRGLADTRGRLEPILKRCPNLQYLIGVDTKNVFCALPSRTNRNNSSSCNASLSTTTYSEGIQLDELFSWCPKLIYFMGKGMYYTAEGQDDLAQNAFNQSQCHHDSFLPIGVQNNNNNDRGLYYLAQCDNNNATAPFVIRHQETLKCLILNKNDNDSYQGTDWSSVFRASLTDLGQLRTLICRYIEYNEDQSSIIHLLNRCPRLDTLVLARAVFSLSTNAATLNLSIITPLNLLPYLRRLDICGYSFSDEWSVIELMKRLPALEELAIANGRLALNNHSNVFFRYCPKLTHFDLMNITCNHAEGETILTPAMFLYAASLSTPSSSTMQYSNSNNASMAVCNIKHVKLRNVPPVTYKLLTAIAHIPTLESLEVRLSEMYCINNDDGFVLFVQTLRKTVIRKLILYKFDYLQQLHYPIVIDALGRLPYLTELHFESTTMTRAKLDTKDDSDKLAAILTIWNKNKSLNKLVLCNLSARGIWPSTIVQKLLQMVATTAQKEKDYFIVTPGIKQLPRENDNNDNQCWYTATVTITRQQG